MTKRGKKGEKRKICNTNIDLKNSLSFTFYLKIHDLNYRKQSADTVCSIHKFPNRTILSNMQVCNPENLQYFTWTYLHQRVIDKISATPPCFLNKCSTHITYTSSHHSLIISHLVLDSNHTGDSWTAWQGDSLGRTSVVVSLPETQLPWVCTARPQLTSLEQTHTKTGSHVYY